MPVLLRLGLLLASLSAIAPPDARAERETVCTITINSPDEKEALERNLPPERYRFVELVERGRPDWFAAACRRDVRCDVLVISGHFDDGTEFYSERLGARESLPVDAMERASCSNACASVFSQLKEVYLFGCNTLETAPLNVVSAEINRSLVRSGHSPEDADRIARELGELHGESNADRMRHVFKDVPAIYGFSAKAPLGAAAGPALEHYFRSGADGNFGTGRPSAKLVAALAPASMTLASGVTASDADAGVRRDLCQLDDDHLTAAQKLVFIHALLDREPAEVRMLLGRIEKYIASLSDADRASPEAAAALAGIVGDDGARRRYLDFARDADEPATRARMIELASALGWLSAAGKRAELAQMFAAQLAAPSVGVADIDLACSLNRQHALDLAFDGPGVLPPEDTSLGQAALRACLGDAAARTRLLRGLASANAGDVEIAQAYLRHRPLADAAELRAVAAAVLRMPASAAQVRALETLAGYRLSDHDTLQSLTRLFALAKSIDMQRAIAGVLIRADYATIASPALVHALRTTRLKSPDGADVIDILIRRLAS